MVNTSKHINRARFNPAVLGMPWFQNMHLLLLRGAFISHIAIKYHTNPSTVSDSA